MPLPISPDLLEKVDIARDVDFIDAISHYLVGRFQLETRPGFTFESLVREVEPIVAQAGNFGLPRYDGHALHVVASFVLGVDYHETPNVKPILHSKTLSGDLKALWLDRWFHSLEGTAIKKART